MKTKTGADSGSQYSYEVPFTRFVRDFLRFATTKLAVDVEQPCVGLLIIPDDDSWRRLMCVIEHRGSHDLRDAKAVAIYVPLTLAQRVRLASELQRVCPGQYDRFLDFDALVCVPRPKLAVSMLQVVLDFYYAIAASCMRLVILVKVRSGGVSVVTRYDTFLGALTGRRVSFRRACRGGQEHAAYATKLTMQKPARSPTCL